jgi:hypothetical protein
MTTWHWAPRGNNAAQRASTSFAYVPNSSAVRCTDDQLDRGLLRNQEPTYRPARPPPTSPSAPMGGRSGVNQEERSRYFSRFLNASRRSTAGDGPRSRSCTLRLDATPCPPDPAAAVLVAGDTGGLPARQGHFLVGCRLCGESSTALQRCGPSRGVKCEAVPMHGQ